MTFHRLFDFCSVKLGKLGWPLAEAVIAPEANGIRGPLGDGAISITLIGFCGRPRRCRRLPFAIDGVGVGVQVATLGCFFFLFFFTAPPPMWRPWRSESLGFVCLPSFMGRRCGETVSETRFYGTLRTLFHCRVISRVFIGPTRRCPVLT